jgi:hypothetical protein
MFTALEIVIFCVFVVIVTWILIAQLINRSRKKYDPNVLKKFAKEDPDLDYLSAYDTGPLGNIEKGTASNKDSANK